MVKSSANPFICMAPSPTNAIAGRSGWANLAPIAYGTAGPIVAKVPDKDPLAPLGNRRHLAYQFVDDPESAVTMALLGSCSDSSHTTRIGFTGVAVNIACRSMVSHHRLTFFSTCSRQERSSV